MSGEQIQRGPEQRGDEADSAQDVGATAINGAIGEETKARHEKLTDDVDAILDEIDEVLEENAEEFVRGYIQGGGQ